MEFLTLVHAKKYTDEQRLAYEETKVTKLADFVVIAGQGTYDGEEMVIEAPCIIEKGKLYIVTINGKSFETYGSEDSRGQYIKIVDNETTVFEAYFISPRFYVRSLDPNGQDNDANRYVTIEARETIVHAIDGKFLPVGGVGYEEAVPTLADFVMPAGKGGSSSAYIKAPFLFTEGDNWEKTYSITVNGKTYAVTGKKNSETFEIGNYDRTVEPHLYIEEFPNYGLWNIYVYDPNGLTDIVDRHIVITEKPTTHAIDPKYLPVGGVSSAETKVTKYADFIMPAGEWTANIPSFSVDIGKSFYCTINGKTFNGDWHAGADYDGVGDPQLTSVPFFIKATGNGFRVIALDPDTRTDTVYRHITIETRETVTHITETPAFGSMCLPVVEFTKSYSTRGSSNQSVSAEDNAQLEAMASAMTPFIAKIKAEYGQIAYVMNFTQDGNTKEYTAYHSTYPACFRNTNNLGWVFVGIQAP